MKALRTVGAALAILAGAACVVAWLVSFLALRALEDGSLARGVARAALASPSVTSTIAGELEQAALAGLASQGIDLASVGLGDALGPVMSELAGSATFRDAVLAQVDDVNAQVVAELAEPGRAPGPIVVSVNASPAVNDALRDLPLVGGTLPQLTVAPVDVPVMSSDAAERARDGYARLDFGRDWLGWIGLIFLAGGFLISTRPAYVAGKFLIATGAFSLALALAAVVASPDRLVGLLPGGADAGAALRDALGEIGLDGWARLLGIVGVSALALGAAAVGIARAAARR